MQAGGGLGGEGGRGGFSPGGKEGVGEGGLLGWLEALPVPCMWGVTGASSSSLSLPRGSCLQRQLKRGLAEPRTGESKLMKLTGKLTLDARLG